MILFVDLVIMSFTYLLVLGFVDYQSLLIYCIQILDGVFLLLTKSILNLTPYQLE